MKLDKIRFAWLVSYLTEVLNSGNRLTQLTVESLDEIIDVDVPEQAPELIYPKNEQVEALMKHMAEGISKLDAIRYHRDITGMGLKDSKDAVERYWENKFTKWTKEELFDRLTQSSYNADEEAAIKLFLLRL
jgi:ribosomal protein L7/L12